MDWIITNFVGWNFLVDCHEEFSFLLEYMTVAIKDSNERNDESTP